MFRHSEHFTDRAWSDNLHGPGYLVKSADQNRPGRIRPPLPVDLICYKQSPVGLHTLRSIYWATVYVRRWQEFRLVIHTRFRRFLTLSWRTCFVCSTTRNVTCSSTYWLFCRRLHHYVANLQLFCQVQTQRSQFPPFSANITCIKTHLFCSVCSNTFRYWLIGGLYVILVMVFLCMLFVMLAFVVASSFYLEWQTVLNADWLRSFWASVPRRRRYAVFSILVFWVERLK